MIYSIFRQNQKFNDLNNTFIVQEINGYKIKSLLRTFQNSRTYWTQNKTESSGTLLDTFENLETK